MLEDAEAAAQRARDEAGPGGGPHQRELRQLQADGTGRGTLPQHDVYLELLHGGVEVLLRHAPQPMYLVDEEHVARLQGVGERSEERRVGKECRSRWWPDQ